MDPRCPLCRTDGGDLVWRGAACRVVLVAEPGLPGYGRVVWNAHVRELSDLSSGELAVLWRTVAVVEQAVRACIGPHKVNVAALGNVVPHLHVHVVPRWRDDPYFPATVWGARAAAVVRGAAAGDGAGVAALRAELRRCLAGG